MIIRKRSEINCSIEQFAEQNRHRNTDHIYDQCRKSCQKQAIEPFVFRCHMQIGICKQNIRNEYE